MQLLHFVHSNRTYTFPLSEKPADFFTYFDKTNNKETFSVELWLMTNHMKIHLIFINISYFRSCYCFLLNCQNIKISGKTWEFPKKNLNKKDLVLSTQWRFTTHTQWVNRLLVFLWRLFLTRFQHHSPSCLCVTHSQTLSSNKN